MCSTAAMNQVTTDCRVRCRNQKKTKITEKEDVQDTLKEMKQMLRVLCEKVDRNEKCLKELKTCPRLVFKINCKMH